MLNYNKKANIVFCQISTLGLISLSLLLFLSAALYFRLSIIKNSLLGKLELICGCANHLSFSNHPWLSLFLISAGLSLLVFIGSALFKTFKIIKSTNNFLGLILQDKKHFTSPKLKKIVSLLGLQKKIIKIKNSNPIIFCYGLIKPKICVSTGLVKKLNQKELLAVLSHEKHHLTVHEPIKLFTVKALVKILFFVPGIKPLAKQYFVFSELAADEKATNNFRYKIPLARALYKIIKWRRTDLAEKGLAVSFFSDIIEERIKKLENNKKINTLKNSYFRLSVGVFFLFFSFLTFSAFFNSNELNALSHSGGACPMEHAETKIQCHKASDPTCTMNYTYGGDQLCR